MAEQYLAAGQTNLSTGFSVADDAELVIADGSQIVNAGLDTTGDTTNGIHYFHVRPGFTGQVGTSGASAEFELESGYDALPQFVHRGASTVRLVIDTSVHSIAASSGRTELNGGTHTLLVCESGTIAVSDSTIVATLNASGGTVTLGDNSTAITTANVSGGSVSSERHFTTLNVNGGTVFHDSDGDTTATVNLNGGRFVHISGNITTLNINSPDAVYDTSMLKRSATIATSNNYGGPVPKPSHLTITTENNQGTQQQNAQI